MLRNRRPNLLSSFSDGQAGVECRLGKSLTSSSQSLLRLISSGEPLSRCCSLLRRREAMNSVQPGAQAVLVPPQHELWRKGESSVRSWAGVRFSHKQSGGWSGNRRFISRFVSPRELSGEGGQGQLPDCIPPIQPVQIPCPEIQPVQIVGPYGNLACPNCCGNDSAWPVLVRGWQGRGSGLRAASKWNFERN